MGGLGRCVRISPQPAAPTGAQLGAKALRLTDIGCSEHQVRKVDIPELHVRELAPSEVGMRTWSEAFNA
jgi:hypothetical protein